MGTSSPRSMRLRVVNELPCPHDLTAKNEVPEVIDNVEDQEKERNSLTNIINKSQGKIDKLLDVIASAEDKLAVMELHYGKNGAKKELL